MLGDEYVRLLLNLCDATDLETAKKIEQICQLLWASAQSIDPDSNDRLVAMRIFDKFGVKGLTFLKMHTDLCLGSAKGTIVIAHALNFGLLTVDELNSAIIKHGTPLNYPQLEQQVVERLPHFDVNSTR